MVSTCATDRHEEMRFKSAITWPLIQGRAMKTDIFLFVNRSSGGQRGEALMEVPQPFEVALGDGKTASLKVFDMREGASGQKPGFAALKEASRCGVVRMVVAGGDGTILWAIEEAEKHFIDTRSQVLLAVVPLGTGNDFSRFSGWGGRAPNMRRLFRRNHEGLRRLVQEWATARPQQHDIWQVVLEVDETRGLILQTGKDRKKAELSEKRVTKLMHSYFSAGNDARAGMSQEKKRTSTRWGNMLNYGFQICLKGLPFREKEYVRDFVSSLHHGNEASAPVIFNNKDAEHDSSEWCPAPQLVGNPEVLIILNIPNCYGGFCRFWDTAGSCGVKPAGDPQLLESKLDPSDGKLEVLTYGSLLLDPVMSATPLPGVGAKRVFSGAPLHLEFIEGLDTVRVHIQIDGEFFKLINPTSATFVLHRKIRVLYGGRDYEPATEGEEWDEESTESDSTDAGPSA